MNLLLEQLEYNFGSYMLGELYFDFGCIEAAVDFLKNNRGHTPTPKCKEILNQFVNNHVTNQNYTVKNQDGTYSEYPLADDIDKCFDAWWKDLPAPRCLAQQKAEYEAREQQNIDNYQQTMPVLGSYHDVVPRVQVKQAQVLMDEQMHAAYEDEGPRMGQAENTALRDLLLSKPEKARLAWHNFDYVTSGQLDGKLEELGIIDKNDRAKVKKYILEQCKDTNAITLLSDNELPLQLDEVAEWVHDDLKGTAVYMQDSDTWYYLRGNKYESTPDYHQGNPVDNSIKKYWRNLCNQYAARRPLWSRTIEQARKEQLKQISTLKKLIGTVETDTEEEFNNKVLEEGRFCTPNGLYSYTHKISDSNGLTKVTTKANILDMTAQDINTCEGVQLFSRFMKQIQPNQETRNYLIGVIANAITGHRENEYTYIFHGSTGANGKSVLTELLEDMLGNYCERYTTDCLVRHSQSGKPAEAAKALENRRLVIGSEIGDGSRIDGGAFKRYFSNDSYRIREIYKAAYTVKPTHTMFLPVNQMPNFGSDPAVRRRLVVIPFTEHFVMNPDPSNPHEHQLNPDTKKNLIAHEDEIFTYLVCYAEQLRNENITLTVPATVQQYGDDMVNENNILDDFISRQIESQTAEEIKDPTIPTPCASSSDLFDLFIESLTPGAYNPYKTHKSFISAFLLKCPQLEKPKNTRTKDDKVVKAIHGVWIKKDTTAAKQLEAKRWDKENLRSIPLSEFAQNDKYEKSKKDIDVLNTIAQAEQYVNEPIVKIHALDEPDF